MLRTHPAFAGDPVHCNIRGFTAESSCQLDDTTIFSPLTRQRAAKPNDALPMSSFMQVLTYPGSPEDFHVLVTRERHAHKSILMRGRYGEQLHRYLKYFPRRQMLVFLTEEFFADAHGVMDRIQKFLGLPGMNYRSG